jgi:hypothetical protein
MVFVVDETFSTISGEEIPNVYQVVVEKVTDNIEPLDNKVSKTIINVIETFFSNEENSLLYICDEKGNKAEQRFKVFDRWYRKSQIIDDVIKRDNILKIKVSESVEKIIFTSFLFHKRNKDYEKLIEIYNLIEDTLNEK